MPMDRSKYPPYWDDLSLFVREVLAGDRCEGGPDYPDCTAENGEPHPVTGSKVVLTVAHLDHDPGNNEFQNLRALCQRCHLAHDREQHALTRALRERTEKIEAGQLEIGIEAADTG
jgi:5-methylcytosine-specific restriction endonuclease McrA